MSELTPEEIAEHRFATVFRGYDPQEVRTFLLQTAQGTQLLRVRVAELGDDLARQRRDAETSAARRVAPVYDDATGEEVADEQVGSNDDVLAAQHDAEAIVVQARREAAQIVQAANDEAARLVFLARAEARGKPVGEAMALANDGPDDPSEAHLAARAMVAEARAVRERILTDLAKRRRTAHVQLEQLRAAREKLVESLRDARRMVDDTTRDLSSVEVEARLAAEAAGRRVSAEPLPTAQELDAELLGGSPFRLTMSPRPLDAVAPEDTAAATVVMPGEVAMADNPAVADADPVAEPEGVAVVDVEVVDVDEVDVDAVEDVVVVDAVGDVVVVDVVVETMGVDGERPGVDRRRVDDLFARLRAEREVAGDARARVRDGADGPETVTNGATALSVQPAVAPPPAPAPAPNPSTAQPAAEAAPEPGPSPLTSDDEAVLDRREHALELLDARLAKAVRRHLQDEQGAALAAIRTHKGRLEVASLLGSADDHRRSYIDLLLPRLLEAAEAGAELVRNELSVAASDPDRQAPRREERRTLPEAASVEASAIARELCERMVTPLRDRVGIAIEDGFGDDAHDIVEAVNDGYREWKSEQVQRAVVNALRAAFAAGSFHASPAESLLRWILDDGESACAECDDNVLAGAVPHGATFPTGHRHPPVHPGCHCTVIPLLG